MTNAKILVRILISLICFYGAINGQTLNRRQQAILQRQQKQLDLQQETLEKQLISQAILTAPRDQNQTPINYAVLDSIFNVPIQAIKAVNELVRTLAAVRARLNGQKTADLVEEIQN